MYVWKIRLRGKTMSIISQSVEIRKRRGKFIHNCSYMWEEIQFLNPSDKIGAGLYPPQNQNVSFYPGLDQSSKCYPRLKNFVLYVLRTVYPLNRIFWVGHNVYCAKLFLFFHLVGIKVDNGSVCVWKRQLLITRRDAKKRKERKRKEKKRKRGGKKKKKKIRCPWLYRGIQGRIYTPSTHIYDINILAYTCPHI